MKTVSLNQALKYASKYGYDQIMNSIEEKFSFPEFYKQEGNSRGWIVVPNLPGKSAKMYKYIRGGHAYRMFTLLEK